MINTGEVISSQRSGSSARTSGASTRRPTEQELEIARLREEMRQRDAYMKAQNEYYARVQAEQQAQNEYYARVQAEQQKLLLVSTLRYYSLFIPFQISCAILTYLVDRHWLSSRA